MGDLVLRVSFLSGGKQRKETYIRFCYFGMGDSKLYSPFINHVSICDYQAQCFGWKRCNKIPLAGIYCNAVTLTERRDIIDCNLSFDQSTLMLAEERRSDGLDCGNAQNLQFDGQMILEDAIDHQRSHSFSKLNRANDSIKHLVSLKSLVFELDNADTIDEANHVLSQLVYLGPVEFEGILHALKHPEKITMLLSWMKSKSIKTDNFQNHALVFRALARRQEWELLDGLLQEQTSQLEGNVACKLFSIALDLCSAMGCFGWAFKWFRYMVSLDLVPDETAYASVMSLCRRFEKLKEAVFVYQHMLSMKVHSLKAYSVMMNLYTRAGMHKKVQQVFAKMNQNGVVSGKEGWYFQLTAYVRRRKVHQAEKLIQNMQTSGIIPDIFVYNCMILVYGKSDNFKGATYWYLKIEEDGLQPDGVTFRSMIGACGRAGKLLEAFGYYDRMRQFGFHPNLRNFNTLIYLHGSVEANGSLLSLLADMKEIECCPNSSTLDAVMKVYERYGRLETVPQALELLRQAGWLPDEKCYGIIIRTYIRCNLAEQALDAFDYLCSRAELGQSLCHDLICMCESLGCFEEAIHVYKRMQKIGSIKPSLQSSCTLLKIYSLQGAIEEGEALFNELRMSKEELDSFAYNVAITMYLRADLPERAAEVMKLANNHEGFQPDSYLFVSMLKVCSKCGLAQDVVGVYWRMVMAKLSWNESMFNAVIHYCGRALPLEEITKVFQAMLYAKIPINTVTCNVMIDIFGKAGLLENAEKVLRLAQKQQSHDHISFNTIIDAYGKYKEFDKMEVALVQMQNEGFKSSIEAYNSVIDAYGKNGQIGKMENILERMKMHGCEPNMATFNTLINLYGREGLIVDMQRVLSQMEEVGSEPDSYTYNILIKAYGNVEMPDEALRSLREMQDAGFTPDRITYINLISALEKAGDHEEAARWSVKLKECLSDAHS